MKIKEIFQSDITRDIPPVIYFHEQKPEKLLEEVNEYIITGGYEEGDPRRQRTGDGIHEQFVHLLKALSTELGRSGGVELPACWISGFYGSGKSSFAKLLGLSLDERVLPDGRKLSAALLARDDSPRRQELHAAWSYLRGQLDPLAVVFDIGAMARDDEHIHTAAKRQLQERLGYCPGSHYVADFELKLEQDNEYERFLSLAEQTLGKPWSQARAESLAEDHFSEVMHAMFPSRYEDPMAWLDIRTGSQAGVGTAVDETVRDIEAMLGFRAPGKTVFLVVDEVSQYIHGHEARMLKLQTFVAALGQRLKGRVWIFATGQQKIEEDVEGGNISKLKDRFPPRLRVHLAPTNIRDVVHKRLLKKDPLKVRELEALFDQHRPDLCLYGYKCDQITSMDFLEVYPMLPAHVDLLMQITSSLRARSTRMKGDDHAIRGLLQLLGELFRELELGEQPLGTLLTIDQIYDVQHTALDADVQNTMARLASLDDLVSDRNVMRAARAVALLELIQDQEPTTPELVARCLYPRLGAGSEVEALRSALEKLAEHGILSRSEKQGYRIQSSAGQDWANERDSYGVTGQAVSVLVAEKLKQLVGQADRPRYRNRPFPLAASFSDGRATRDERLVSPNDPAVVGFDLAFLTRQEERREELWLKESDEQLRRDRIVWVCGSTTGLEQRARELIRSRQMVGRYEPRQQSLPEARRRLLYDERTRLDHLENDFNDQVAACFLAGELYFRARKLNKESWSRSFPNVLQAAGQEVLPALYPHFTELAITEGDMRQLLEFELRGVSNKFLPGELGLLELDSGRYSPTCRGEVPTRIKEFIIANNGTTGANLLGEFGGPPYGYAPDIVRASVLGLLRGSFVVLRPASGVRVTSVQDPDVQDLFRRDRDFKLADILPADDSGLTPQARVKLRRFLSDSLRVEADPDNDHLADAIFRHFPSQLEKLQELQQRLARLPRQSEVPRALEQLGGVLARCMRSRHVEDVLKAVLQHLDALRDGLQHLGIYLGDLTEDSLRKLNRVDRVRTVELEQLRTVGLEQEVARDWDQLERQFDAPCPWREVDSVVEAAERIQSRYREARADYLDRQDKLYQELHDRLILRDGFNKLKSEQSDHVLRPLREARCTTTPEATSPALAFLRDSVPAQLRHADEEANRRFDEIVQHVVIVPLRVKTTGREFNNLQELEAFLQELRDRISAQLKEGVRVRLT
ncbi:MAG: hypothetical protein AMXMBFR33_12790 [Candidatus Xenobia bacterium]